MSCFYFYSNITMREHIVKFWCHMTSMVSEHVWDIYMILVHAATADLLQKVCVASVMSKK